MFQSTSSFLNDPVSSFCMSSNSLIIFPFPLMLIFMSSKANSISRFARSFFFNSTVRETKTIDFYDHSNACGVYVFASRETRAHVHDGVVENDHRPYRRSALAVISLRIGIITNLSSCPTVFRRRTPWADISGRCISVCPFGR